MDVYLVPIGPERYELYCEAAEEPPVAHEEASNGLFRRLQERFSQMLAAVEREYERERARIRSHRHQHDGFFRRLRARSVRWLAERVAEQRLLWRLRGQQQVRALYPTQLDDTRAMAVIRKSLEADADQHSRWLVIDGVGLILSGVLVPFPGPNLLGYYFTFRVVGHILAMRGAKHGLRKVAWSLEESPPLGRLADLDGLPPGERLERVRAIERELGLCKLARFLERIVVRTA
jgi:hypothetical protein